MKMPKEEERNLPKRKRNLIRLETNQRKSISIMITVISMLPESLKEKCNN